MKLVEKYYSDLFSNFKLVNSQIEVNRRVLNENSELTFYELRSFIALLLKTVNKSETKTILNDLLYSLGKLEVLNKPTPTIKRLKSISPKIFQ